MKVLRVLISLVTTNFLVKLLSVFLAVVLWYGLDAQVTDRSEHDVPVDVILVNQKNWQVMQGEVKKASITIKGTRSDIARIADMVVRDRLRGVIRIDERQIQETEGQLVRESDHTLTAEIFNLHFRDLVFERIRPRRINIRLVRIGRKQLTVKPVLVGDPEKGYEVLDVKVTPSKIDVRGPSIVLDKVDEIQAEPVYLHFQDETFTQKNVSVASKLGEYDVKAGNVSVQVIIGKKPLEKVIPRVPIRVYYPRRWPRERLRLEIDERLDVKVRGPAQLVEKLTAKHLLLIAELDEAEWTNWMDEKSKTQDASASLNCFVVGPSEEAERLVKPVLPSEKLMCKLIRIK